jgi:integrase/recombinase XerD
MSRPEIGIASALTVDNRLLLTSAEFHRLAAVPPEIEWFANIGNASTKRAYENAIQDFMRFTGIARPEEFRTVTRAHVIAWRDDLVRRDSAAPQCVIASRRSPPCSNTSAKNAVTHNPVKGVKRPRSESGEGKTPALGDHQARDLLADPAENRVKGKRSRSFRRSSITRCGERSCVS